MRKILFPLLLIVALSAHAGGGFLLKDMSGKTLNLSDYKGKWVLVNFWATWCPPCLAEIPDLASLREKNLAVIGVAVSYKNAQEVEEFAKSHKMAYPIVLGDEDTASQFGGIDALPTSFLFSPDGHLAGKRQGPITKKEIQDAIR